MAQWQALTSLLADIRATSEPGVAEKLAEHASDVRNTIKSWLMDEGAVNQALRTLYPASCEPSFFTQVGCSVNLIIAITIIMYTT